MVVFQKSSFLHKIYTQLLHINENLNKTATNIKKATNLIETVFEYI